MNTYTLNRNTTRSSIRPTKLATLALWLRASFSTSNAHTPVLLRLALALTIFPHGIQKVLGWWGGYGFSATMNAFTSMMGIPAPLALAAILAEFVGPILLVFGLFTRLSAFAIGVTMAVAALTVHWQHGFFLPQGIEFFIPLVAISIALLISGAGRWSLDSLVARKLDR
jgi:putative oxidoreductase